MTDITIIIPTYHRGSSLCKVLRCILCQTTPPREIILVDQNEKHDLKTETFLKQLVEKKKMIHLRQGKPNAQTARNLGIQKARGQVLLFIDDDVKFENDFVLHHWENYKNPAIDGVCGFFLEPGETPLDELPKECGKRHTGWIYMPHGYQRRVESFCWPSCNGSIKREIAIKAGGFDENFTHTLLDDTDFSCRLKRLGAKLIHDPEAKLVHLKEKTGGKRPAGVNEYVIADANTWYTWCYFFWINFGWQGWPEILVRLRRCVFRRTNILKPWFLLKAMTHFMVGSVKAVRSILEGRKLGFPQGQPLQ